MTLYMPRFAKNSINTPSYQSATSSKTVPLPITTALPALLSLFRIPPSLPNHPIPPPSKPLAAPLPLLHPSNDIPTIAIPPFIPLPLHRPPPPLLQPASTEKLSYTGIVRLLLGRLERHEAVEVVVNGGWVAGTAVGGGRGAVAAGGGRGCELRRGRKADEKERVGEGRGGRGEYRLISCW